MLIRLRRYAFIETIPCMNRILVANVLGLAGLAPMRAAEPPEKVRAVVVANFENGADSGDAPGEYQFWVEREHLDEKVDIHGAPDVLRRNKEGLYGLVLRHGMTDLVALILDPRFDLRKTYWLFTGISGVDPRAASVGSVAWSRWVVAGDAMREIDDRTIPEGWPYGLWPIGSQRPNQLPTDPNHFGPVTDASQLSMAYPLNERLALWAYAISRDAPLADDNVIKKRRAEWKGFPQAQRPPFVLLGETLGSRRYWHGEPRTRWAEDWTKLWTGGRGLFVMTNMESQTNQEITRALAALGFVDAQRIMVLRSASNFSEPPPGIPVTASIGDEGPGQVIAFDNNQRAGSPVLHELLSHWDRYENSIPGRNE
jgi:purine nucleoside permease